jgi:site-specific DNA-adenine methylase
VFGKLNDFSINNKTGIPYPGNKKKIGIRILETINNTLNIRDNSFIDVFGGGGSMSSFAYQSKLFNKIYYNDIRKDIVELVNYLIENDLDERFNTYITRSEFENIKDSTYFNAFIISCYGYGNLNTNYFCGSDKEIIKQKVHNVIMFDDYSGFEKNEIELIDSMKERSLLYPIEYNSKGFVSNFFERYHKLWTQDTTKVLRKYPVKYRDYGVWFNNELGVKGSKMTYKKKDLIPIDAELQGLMQLQHLEQLTQLYQFNKLKPNLITSNLSFIDLDIPKDSIVYLDPPYYSTVNSYTKTFDYDCFLHWAKDLKVPAFLSEYTNTLDWIEVLSIEKRNNMSKTKQNNFNTERLFWNGIKTL